jgi:hypothetical protein
MISLDSADRTMKNYNGVVKKYNFRMTESRDKLNSRSLINKPARKTLRNEQARYYPARQGSWLQREKPPPTHKSRALYEEEKKKATLKKDFPSVN